MGEDELEEMFEKLPNSGKFQALMPEKPPRRTLPERDLR